VLDREGEGVGGAILGEPAADALPSRAGRLLAEAQGLGGGAERVVLESHKSEELLVGATQRLDGGQQVRIDVEVGAEQRLHFGGIDLLLLARKPGQERTVSA
jgi:hypothetical protein